jgi:serine/threonine-protein kinase
VIEDAGISAVIALQGRLLGGRYELGALLGTGGMASVYQATDRVLGRRVAVKVLGPPYDQDPAFVERFRHEARMAAALNHPGVVAIFDSASEGDLHYLVMEYVQGQTLAELLRDRGPLSPRLAAEIAQRVCLALGAAHEQGLVHRDVKPANVMVDRAGMVKVMDFGIAKTLAATAPRDGEGPLGTAPYLSPEQAQGGPVDGRSDLYALGCVLYELLTGTPPFPGRSPSAVVARQVREPPEPPSRRNPQVGPELDAVVLTALAKPPDQRYQTAAAMGRALTGIVGAGGGPVPLRPRGGPAGGPPGSTGSPSASATTAVIATRAVRADARRAGLVRWALLGGVVLVAVLVAAVVWSLRGGGEGTPPAAPVTAPGLTATTAPARPTTTVTPEPGSSVPAALANLTRVVATGQRQGTIGKDGDDLLHQADEVGRAVQQGRPGQVRKRLRDLERKADELIRNGQVSPSAAGGVRQALAQLETAVRRS